MLPLLCTDTKVVEVGNMYCHCEMQGSLGDYSASYYYKMKPGSVFIPVNVAKIEPNLRVQKLVNFTGQVSAPQIVTGEADIKYNPSSDAYYDEGFIADTDSTMTFTYTKTGLSSTNDYRYIFVAGTLQSPCESLILFSDIINHPNITVTLNQGQCLYLFTGNLFTASLNNFSPEEDFSVEVHTHPDDNLLPETVNSPQAISSTDMGLLLYNKQGDIRFNVTFTDIQQNTIVDNKTRVIRKITKPAGFLDDFYGYYSAPADRVQYLESEIVITILILGSFAIIVFVSGIFTLMYKTLQREGDFNLESKKVDPGADQIN